MAVTNIFNLCWGLGIPWFVFSASHDWSDVTIDTKHILGTFIAMVVITFVVLMSVICFNYKIHKKLGWFMLLLYALYMIQDVIRADTGLWWILLVIAVWFTLCVVMFKYFRCFIADVNIQTD